MAPCSPILIGRLSVDKTDPTVIDLHADDFSNTVRKVKELVGLRSGSAVESRFIGYSSLILTDFYCYLSFFSFICLFNLSVHSS